MSAVYTPEFLQEREAIQAQIRRARDVIAGHEAQIRIVEGELSALAEQRHRYELLSEVCDALERLETVGAGNLFWGEVEDVAAHVRVERARGQAAQFLENVATIEQRRARLLEQIQEESLNVDGLGGELVELHDKELRRQSEFIIEREMNVVPFRPMVMPWDPQGEDAKKFRKVLFISLLVTFTLGTGIGLWKLPKESKYQVVAMPERVVKMVQQKAPPPPPPEPVKPKEETPPETALAEKSGNGDSTAPAGDVKQARAKAQGSGLLAFRNSFSDLMGGAEPKLGAEAQLGVSARNNGGSRAIGANSERSLLVAQASSGSGGIQVATMSRGLGSGGNGSGSGGMEGVRIARVTDAIGGGDGGGGGRGNGRGDRPLSNGPGPSRTDEEIQIVFDRYKAALYRIYNRELRNDPTLRGKMVLRLVIEPGGEVSSCKVESTDLRSPSLVAEIVDRVSKFNFGAKDKVSRVTILYPIDFLPAN